MRVEVVWANAGEVAAVGFARDEVEVFKDVFDVVPVLLQDRVGRVHNYELDGGEEVEITFFVGFVADCET